MRQEGWPAAPSEAQPPLNGWRSDASTETGARGCRKTPPPGCEGDVADDQRCIRLAQHQTLNALPLGCSR